MSEAAFNQWCVVEMMGHRRLYGHVTETTIAGVGVLRVDVFSGDAGEPLATSYMPAASLYNLTVTTQAACRAAAARGWLPSPAAYLPVSLPAEDEAVGDDDEWDDSPGSFEETERDDVADGIPWKDVPL